LREAVEQDIGCDLVVDAGGEDDLEHLVAGQSLQVGRIRPILVSSPSGCLIKSRNLFEVLDAGIKVNILAGEAVGRLNN